MSSKITAHRAPGTRDFLPEEMALRQRVRRVIEETFQLYGFQPLETPATERLDVLTGKYGEEADRLIFKILKRGEDLQAALGSGELADLGLRYDLTVPLARVVAMNRGTLTYPFKRYQIQPVWRAERQQKGRYREFVQCDVDIVGSASPSADAEIIALTDDILQRLGIPGYRIYINHRGILQAIAEVAEISSDRFLEMCGLIDKFDKIGFDGVRTELNDKAFGKKAIDLIISLIQISGNYEETLEGLAQSSIVLTSTGRSSYLQLQELLENVTSLGVPQERMALALHLARGLDYYTGPIFETLIEEPKTGSITGGGRYDNLIGVFCGETIPATGTSFGIERIFDVMKELKLFGDVAAPSAQVLVTVFSDETRAESLKIAAELRKAGIATEVFLEAGKKLGKQFAYADRKRIPYVIVAGPEEISKGEVTLKSLTSGEQQIVARLDLIVELKRKFVRE